MGTQITSDRKSRILVSVTSNWLYAFLIQGTSGDYRSAIHFHRCWGLPYPPDSRTSEWSSLASPVYGSAAVSCNSKNSVEGNNDQCDVGPTSCVLQRGDSIQCIRTNEDIRSGFLNSFTTCSSFNGHTSPLFFTRSVTFILHRSLSCMPSLR